MQRSRRELLDDFLEYVGEPGSAKARNVAERLLNLAVETIWLSHSWRDFESPAPFQLTLVPGQRSYALPDYVGRIGPGGVRNLTRRGRPLTPSDPGMLPDDFRTDAEIPAQPRTYIFAGVVGVKSQPAASGEGLEVLSSNPADTDIEVTIEGDNTLGDWTRRRVPLLGTTPVTVGVWAYVDGFGKAYREGLTPATELTSSRGNVTLRKTSSQELIQLLYPEESAHEHKLITFYPKPDQADVIAVPVIRRPKRMVYDADPTPGDWFPAIFEELHILWRVHTGDLSDGAAMTLPRPARRMLIENDNLLRMQIQRQPYRGGR